VERKGPEKAYPYLSGGRKVLVPAMGKFEKKRRGGDRRRFEKGEGRFFPGEEMIGGSKIFLKKKKGAFSAGRKTDA